MSIRIRNYLLDLELRASTDNELRYLITKGKYVDECKEELARRGKPYKEETA